MLERENHALWYVRNAVDTDTRMHTGCGKGDVKRGKNGKPSPISQTRAQ